MQPAYDAYPHVDRDRNLALLQNVIFYSFKDFDQQSKYDWEDGTLNIELDLGSSVRGHVIFYLKEADSDEVQQLDVLSVEPAKSLLIWDGRARGVEKIDLILPKPLACSQCQLLTQFEGCPMLNEGLRREKERREVTSDSDKPIPASRNKQQGHDAIETVAEKPQPALRRFKKTEEDRRTEEIEGCDVANEDTDSEDEYVEISFHPQQKRVETDARRDEVEIVDEAPDMELDNEEIAGEDIQAVEVQEEQPQVPQAENKSPVAPRRSGRDRRKPQWYDAYHVGQLTQNRMLQKMEAVKSLLKIEGIRQMTGEQTAQVIEAVIL